MKKILVSDISLRESNSHAGVLSSFKEKVSFARQLDSIGIDIIETMPITDYGTDLLFLKTISPLLKNTVISCPISAAETNVIAITEALGAAAHARLNVMLPTSAVQMEYLCGKKPKQMLETIAQRVSICAAGCSDVEFSAIDATRSDFDFLCTAIETAINAGAKTITVCDTAGIMLPGEFAEFIDKVVASGVISEGIELGIECSDELSSAAASSFAAAISGASVVKASALGIDSAKLTDISKIFQAKGISADLACSIKSVELNRAISRISGIDSQKSADELWGSDNSDAADDSCECITSGASVEDVTAKITKLGYDLDDADIIAVYNSVCRILNKKKSVNLKELDRIIATDAMQGSPVYTLIDYVITSGNHIHTSASMELECNGERKSCAALGDGPIDAALHAIDILTGCRFEMDDFQIRSITEGKEALGEAFIRLRSNGKIYSGRGLSTDITGAGIRAYLSVANKILLDERKG